MIRTRFAPSPTGFLHIGGARTALFSYLYARNQKGEFLLRIEDTDRERSRPEFEKEIIDSLQWLGLQWDGAIEYQSRRLARYQELAADLIKRDLAYEETEQGKKAVKFRMPQKKAVFHDLVRGEIQFDSSLFDDLVIMKSDGYPTYHFACAVDDHDMEISHVIRGEDHVSNTPRQIFLFEAMGWKPPKYAHLSLILGEDGAPLSKRHGSVALSAFKEQGFLPQALLNYLALLGWGPEGNQEFFLLEDLVKKFSLKRVTKAGAKFNPEKLEWVNTQHIKSLTEQDYIRQITEFYNHQTEPFDAEAWKKLALLYRSRIKTYKDLKSQEAYLFSDEIAYDDEILKEFLKDRALKAMLDQWHGKAGSLKEFNDIAALETLTRAVARELGREAKDLIHPLRYALTGKTVSPGLFELMQVLGKERCLKRIQALIRKGA